MALAVGLAACAVVAAFLYWSLVITEGAVFGPRVVSYLYDRSAGGYDALKDVPRGWDEERILRPMSAEIDGRLPTRLLDLATGSGRVLQLFLSDPDFDGEAVGLDSSAGMLEVAWRKVGGWTPRAQLVLASAAQAPFQDESFDAVIMLEALEFMPDPRAEVREIARLVRPGGVVLLTNRIGWEARLMPGRAFSRVDLAGQLERAGLAGVRFEAWQTYYELVWARRPGSSDVTGTWLERARCPDCGQGLMDARQGELECGRGHRVTWGRGAWRFARDRSHG